jgi:UDP-glucose 6-dehydrogenase
MTIDTLNKANAIKKTIDKLEIEHSKISKFYSKKEPLTKEELEELFQIAMLNTTYATSRFKDELKAL